MMGPCPGRCPVRHKGLIKKSGRFSRNSIFLARNSGAIGILCNIGQAAFEAGRTSFLDAPRPPVPRVWSLFDGGSALRNMTKTDGRIALGVIEAIMGYSFKETVEDRCHPVSRSGTRPDLAMDDGRERPTVLAAIRFYRPSSIGQFPFHSTLSTAFLLFIFSQRWHKSSVLFFGYA